MSVSASAFKRWAAESTLPSATSPLAQVIGIGRMTLQRQLVSGRVREETVIAAARAGGMSPVTALSAFEEYEGLERGMKPPSPAEVLSQVTLDDASVALLRRRGGRAAALLGDGGSWEDPPQPNGLKAWIDAVDPGGIRLQLAERLGMSPQQLSREITGNGMRPRHLIEAARLAHTSLTSGLAVAGVVTLQEAGWSADARDQVVSRLSEVELIELVQARLATAHRAARRRAYDDAAARRIEENLG
ncbi:hypothetical protein GW571_15215 (plasmid) [Clavibacter capsici]|uniref:Uncharacterized protein n=1 Tax=Clavibacter capsici TaxID=1874630 RepID=A0A0M5K057_9MICO|nr:hypothetical protein [Clavibacter capsici]ALD14372.1 hypothetical protein AES38_14840 [Clavibacter capsici]QIS40497.1 hypothetical protein GW572_15005 [Clavibacter capsici]QIS43572.1 hypothetical protein GW571_15215 [Clavibacter capsici]QIS46491.1 hypothetical protein GW570_15015 [Clavibacter capsici]